MRNRLLIYWLLLFAPLACTESPGQGRGNADTAWYVDSVPVVDIADAAPLDEAVLEYPIGATRLSNGVVVVGVHYAASVRYFDPSGQLIRSVGGHGRGPEEFSGIDWIGQCGTDSVYIYESQPGRLSVLDSTGAILGRQLRPDLNPVEISCSKRGMFAFQSRPAGMSLPSADAPLVHSPLWLVNAAGDTLQALGEVAFGENRPLGRMTRLAVSDRRLFVGTAESAFVDVYSLGGELLQTAEVGGQVRAPTERNYDRALDGLVAPLSEASAREYWKGWYRERIPMPEELPPYSDLLADPDGVVWAVVSAPGDQQTHLRALLRSCERSSCPRVTWRHEKEALPDGFDGRAVARRA